MEKRPQCSENVCPAVCEQGQKICQEYDVDGCLLPAICMDYDESSNCPSICPISCNSEALVTCDVKDERTGCVVDRKCIDVGEPCPMTRTGIDGVLCESPAFPLCTMPDMV